MKTLITMKNRFYKSLMMGALLLTGSLPALHAGSFSVPWFVVAGGGGTTTNGAFSLSGTFGQWDATELPATNGIFSLANGFWTYPRPGQSLLPGNVLLSDTFTSNAVNASLWTVSGSSVTESASGVLISNAVANDGGVLTSLPFAVNATGLITITRDVTIHPAASTLAGYPGTNFWGQMGISIGGLAPFSVNYASWDYADGVTYMARYGFFLARDGAEPILIADQANVSSNIPPLWDISFREKVTYDPATGIMDYYINDVSNATFNVGALSAAGSPTMTLSFNAYGLGTGDDQLMQDLVVSQAPGVSNSTAIIVLSGNLAFGNVAVGASSTNILTISNAGNSALTVSNIVFSSAVFVGNFTNAVIPAGGSTNLAVTLTPTSATNNYVGTVTVLSDATSGVNTYPLSGVVTSGTLELVIDISGKGTVSPNDSKKTFKSGAKITLKAVPGTGEAFAGWTGSIVSSQNPLVFNITNSMVLQANFVASPFTTAVTGVYDGLFSTTNGVSEETAGMLKGLTVSAKGTYTGSLLVRGASHALSGTFTASGQASNSITRTAKLGGPLVVLMTLGLNDTPPQITGTVAGVSNGITPWVADLVAYRATNNGSGQYTMLLEPTVLGVPGVPSGYGYTLIAKKSGALTLSGALADGAAVTQSVPVTQTGEGAVPVYATLYANTGLVTGWVSLTNSALTGNLDWIKPSTTKAGLYTSGFTNVVLAQGAVWTAPPANTPAIALTSGLLSISGGTQPATLTFDVSLSDKNVLTKTAGTNSATNSLSGTINAKTGLLSITFGNGNKKLTTAGKGAVLQDTTNGGGYFLDKTNAGSIILQP
jgi:hypothetical protein